MQEYQVTAGGDLMPLERPFFVLATQNPVELEGTYPLPEAQLDRFMFNVVIGYLSADDELAVAQMTTSRDQEAIRPVLGGDDIMAFQGLVKKVFVPQNVARFAVDLVRATRPERGGRAGLRAAVGELGRRPPGYAEPAPRRQGARRF